jgi:hypothetical protein
MQTDREVSCHRPIPGQIRRPCSCTRSDPAMPVGAFQDLPTSVSRYLPTVLKPSPSTSPSARPLGQRGFSADVAKWARVPASARM